MKDDYLYSDREISCGRCKAYNAELICSSCDTQFKYTCLNCDNVIHSLPSKKTHKRNPIGTEIEQQHNNSVRIGDRDKQSELSQSLGRLTKGIIGNNPMSSISPIRPQGFNNQLFSIQSNDIQKDDDEQGGYNGKSGQIPTENENFNNNTKISTYFVSDSYSREYVNEIKVEK